MANTAFQFLCEEFEGCRLIWVRFPESVTNSTVSVAIAEYLALWDTDLHIVAINDVRRLLAFTPDDVPVIVAILRRNITQPNFLGSVWLTGGNHEHEAALHEMLVAADRDPDVIFAAEEQALDFLRKRIEHRRR